MIAPVSFTINYYLQYFMDMIINIISTFFNCKLKETMLKFVNNDEKFFKGYRKKNVGLS